VAGKTSPLINAVGTGLNGLVRVPILGGERHSTTDSPDMRGAAAQRLSAKARLRLRKGIYIKARIGA